jgi:hypothetical protein
MTFIILWFSIHSIIHSMLNRMGDHQTCSGMVYIPNSLFFQLFCLLVLVLCVCQWFSGDHFICRDSLSFHEIYLRQSDKFVIFLQFYLESPSVGCPVHKDKKLTYFFISVFWSAWCCTFILFLLKSSNKGKFSLFLY